MPKDLHGWLRLFRYPVRWGALLGAALALVLSFASVSGLVGTVVGVGLGVVLGELAGRSRLRLPAFLGALGILLVAGWLGSSLVVGMRLFPAVLGPGTALHLSALIWYFLLFFSVIAALRSVALRAPAFVVVELALMAGAYASLFAAHRGGAIAQPLWLSSRAWRWGFDPANLLLAFGGVFAVVLAILLLLESKRRLSAVALALVPLVALLAIGAVDIKDLQQLPEASDLAEIQSAMGDPPIPDDKSGMGGKGEGDDEGTQQGGGSEQGEESDAGEGDDGVQPTEAASGEGEGTSEGSDPNEEGAGGSQAGERGESAGGEEAEEGTSGDAQGEQDNGAGESESSEGEPSSGEEEGESSESEEEGESGEAPPPPEMDDDKSPSDGAPRPVAIVLLGDDYEPPSGGFYLRQQVHSEFTGSRLIKASRSDVDLDVMGRFPSSRTMVKEPPPEQGRVPVRGTVAMLVSHTEPFALESPVLYEPMYNPNPQRFVTAYAFESLAQNLPFEDFFGQRVGNAEWSTEVWDHYLDHPPDPQYIELADEILAPLPESAMEDPFTRALAIKVWLDTNVKYSTRERHAGVPDPTADFLFGNRIGYCVHTAHAAVYLWRLQGIPARVGTGYMVDESGRQGSSLIVTDKDAHAWPELYIDGVGWVVMDITPSENLDPPGTPMDEELADILSDMARMKPFEEPPPPVDYSWVRPLVQYTALSTVLILVSFVLAVHWTIKLWRRWRVVFARSVTLPRVGYRLALDLLSESGLSREPGETRERFARRVASVSPAFETLTNLHLEAALGDPNAAGPASPGEVWKVAMREMRRDLAKLPWLARTVGFFNPFSFYRSR